MTSGIGNPDWQRRYDFSPVPLLTLTYADNVNSNSPLTDANGFEYMLVAISMGSSTVFARMQMLWYQDANAANFFGVTDWVVAPGMFVVVKIPVMTRYFKLAVGNVGGATGHTIAAVIYGSNADQENLLTQNTAVPQTYINQAIGSTSIVTSSPMGTYGGPVMVSIDDNANNKWTCWMEYYDWSTQTWRQFWSAHGPDKGQGWAEMVILPYAPTRINIRNDDTVTHSFIVSVVCP